MTGTVLERSLSYVITRLHKLRVLRQQTIVWLLLLVPAVLVTLWLPPQAGLLGPEFPVVLVTTLSGILLARLFVRNPTHTEAARLIEKTDPDLNDAVITAVQVADQPGRRPSVLAAMAVQEAEKLARQRDWSGVVSTRLMAGWTALSFLSFLVMVSSVMAASRFGRDLVGYGDDRSAVERKMQAAAASLMELTIDPGDTEIERGSALTVVARFPEAAPTNAVLEFVDAEGMSRRLTMTDTVDVGVLAARMEEITRDGTYRVLYSETESISDRPTLSPSFKVHTFVRPKLDQVDVVVTPPAWANRPQERIEDVMRLTVTEGSNVTLKLHLNKPVEKAELRPQGSGPVVALRTTIPASLLPEESSAPVHAASSPDPNHNPTADLSEQPSIVEATLTVSESNVWTVVLEDAEGRAPANEDQISIKVELNQPAKIEPTFPGHDTSASPLQELFVEAQASDDFHLIDYGLQYSISGGENREISLKPAPVSAPEVTPAEPAAPLLAATLSHEIALETLKAAPDDLVTFSFWATDIAPDGSERRTYSDIVFAEVRRFEEIFREAQQGGEQQPQPQQNQSEQQDSAVDGVLKLQKEIISATWNTIRGEAASRRNGSFARDVETIAESQGEARSQLQAALQQLQSDPKASVLAARAVTEMTDAQKKLEDIRDGRAGVHLAEAMSIEQVVVQTLLKLRVAETQVRRQEQRQDGGGGTASQQQLQQLELDNNGNRYESEQQAQQQQEMTQQQREQLQVLNRLKELAQRQQMVNERLKQLESELRAATTQSERDEIERELKRLRDEQRELLRDVDELGERMNQTEGPQSPETAERKQQMQEARENVRQASRAMEEGRLAEAIAEGTRAERQFEDLKEDLRDQTSSRFDEAVRDLRAQARELGDRQQELSRQLAGQSPRDTEKPSRSETEIKSEKPSLRSERNRESLQKEFGQQKDRLSRVVEQTRQMIEQAEESEPLLSNTLYDTLRELKDSRPEEALEATEFLAGRGMWTQSQEAEQAARKGIEQLRQGIEKAADSVLGSETESLRRAQEQLDDARQKLAEEVQNATGEPAAKGDGAESRHEEPSRTPGQRGQQGKKAGEDSGFADGHKNEKRQYPGQEVSREYQPRNQAENGEAGSGQSSETWPKGSQNKQGQQPDEPMGGQKSGDQPAGSASRSHLQEQGGSPGKGGEASPQSQTSESGSDQNKQSSGPTGRNLAGTNPSGQRSLLMDGGRESNGGAGNNSAARPLTGDDFGEWSDQLRDVEEMLEDPELRNRVAQVRDRARAMRAEFKRHGEMPQWDLVRSQLLGEMQVLQQRISQELMKLQSDRAMVPIDREPVPEEFDALVQRYYELLGQERAADGDAK